MRSGDYTARFGGQRQRIGLVLSWLPVAAAVQLTTTPTASGEVAFPQMTPKGGTIAGMVLVSDQLGREAVLGGRIPNCDGGRRTGRRYGAPRHPGHGRERQSHTTTRLAVGEKT